MEIFTTTDVSKTGVKLDRFKEWLRGGYVVPSVKKATGRGTKHLFSRFDLYMIKLFDHLMSLGLQREEAAALIGLLNTSQKTGPRNMEAVTDSHFILFILWDDHVKEMNPGDQPAPIRLVRPEKNDALKIEFEPVDAKLAVDHCLGAYMVPFKALKDGVDAALAK